MIQHGPLCIDDFSDPMFQENGYLLWRSGRPDCWIIDPGLPPEPAEMAAAIERNGLSPVAIVLTHAHADHIAGVEPLRKLFPGLPVWCPRDEAELLTSAEANLSAAMGFPIAAAPAERLLDPGEVIELSGLKFECRDVSGHSPGGMAFVCVAEELGDGVAIVGDALFAESIGRYDFPHSDRVRLITNIQRSLMTLPAGCVIYPGHFESSTIDRIRRFNRVLALEIQEVLS